MAENKKDNVSASTWSQCCGSLEEQGTNTCKTHRNEGQVKVGGEGRERRAQVPLHLGFFLPAA
jgi:hypothetical protein